MRIIYCGDSAFIAGNTLECITDDGLSVEVVGVVDVPDSCSVSVRVMGEAKEHICSVAEGNIPKTAFEMGKRYMLTLTIADQRLTLGEFQCLKDSVLGDCIYPRRNDASHAWSVCTSLATLLAETREKLHNHMDGSEVV